LCESVDDAFIILKILYYVLTDNNANWPLKRSISKIGIRTYHKLRFKYFAKSLRS